MSIDASVSAPSAPPKSEIIGSLVPMSRQQAQLMLEAAYLHMDLQQYEAAREVLMGVIALMPRSEVAQLALGTLELVQGRHDKALQSFRVAQRIAPKSALPRAHCGEALLFLGKAQEAMRELSAAIGLEPEGDGGRLARALVEATEAGAFTSTPKAG